MWFQQSFQEPKRCGLPWTKTRTILGLFSLFASWYRAHGTGMSASCHCSWFEILRIVSHYIGLTKHCPCRFIPKQDTLSSHFPSSKESLSFLFSHKTQTLYSHIHQRNSEHSFLHNKAPFFQTIEQCPQFPLPSQVIKESQFPLPNFHSHHHTQTSQTISFFLFWLYLGL